MSSATQVKFFLLKKNALLKKKNLYLISFLTHYIDGVSTKMHQNNVFTVAKRTLEGQDMVYQSVKFTNNVWALAELKIQPGNPNITVINNLPPAKKRIFLRYFFNFVFPAGAEVSGH